MKTKDWTAADTEALRKGGDDWYDGPIATPSFGQRAALHITILEAGWEGVIGELERNGCDCDCEHHREEHDEDCERCLACRIAIHLERAIELEAKS